MRIIKTLFIVCTCIQGLNAQITIDQNDMPNANEIKPYITYSDIGNLDLNQSGENIIWDITNLPELGTAADTFVTVASTPFLYQFFFNNGLFYPEHVADHAIAAPNLNIPMLTMENTFNYFGKNSNDYRSVGFGSTLNGIPLSVQQNPIDFIYHFPLNYGNADEGYSFFEIEVPTLGYFAEDKWRSNTVDAWGTLVTTQGSFEVVRVKSDLTIIDTLYAELLGFGFSIPQPPQTEYKWLAKEMGVPIFQVNTTAGATGLIQMLDLNLPNGIEEVQSEAFLISPSPVLKEMMIQGDEIEVLNLKFFSIDGKLQFECSTYAGTVFTPLLPSPGLYLLHISGEKSRGIYKVLKQ